MTGWVFDAMVALAVCSLLMALYKVPAARNINKYSFGVAAYFFATVSSGYVLAPLIHFDKATILYGVLWGVGYAVLTAIQMHVLHMRDTSGIFPFTSLGSNILVVIGGVLLLHEHISPLQGIAVLFSFVLFAVVYRSDKLHFAGTVMLAFVVIALLSTFNKFVQKFGAGVLETGNFTFWQLFFAFIASIFIWLWAERRIPKIEFPKTEFVAWAALLGVLQVAANFWIIKALATGPIALVYVIIGLYTFFTSVIAALLFKEKITRKSIAVIVASIAIVLLIKIG